MKYVLDSSVAVRWVLAEPHSDKAIRLRDDYRAGQHQLIAPDWFILEVMNVLGKAAARGAIRKAEAVRNYSLILRDAPVFQMNCEHCGSVYASGRLAAGEVPCLFTLAGVRYSQSVPLC